jgi:hypothetical protein
MNQKIGFALSKVLRVLESISVLTYFVFQSLLLTKVIQGYHEQAEQLGHFVVSSILFALSFIAYLMADFVSGFVHFLGDNFGNDQTPFFGPTFILPFRTHHVDPIDITRHGFMETNGNNCLVSLPPLIATFFLLNTSHPLLYFLSYLVCAFLLGIFATNQFHKWAHLPVVKSPVIKFLQEKKLILGPAHHQVHHTSPYDRYYCITVGWLNAPLEKIKFFETILKITGRK